MLQINGNVLNVDDYYITHDYDGTDYLDFDISTSDSLYKSITEHAIINSEDNNYITTKIDGNSRKYIHVSAEVDKRAFKTTFYENYDNGSKKLTEAVSDFLPFGWTFVNNGNTTAYRTLRLEAGTALDLLNNCAALYKVRFKFNAQTKTLTAVNPDSYTLSAAFVTEELNLRGLQYYGDASEFITRLEARGKDGMSFASINDNKTYVENYNYSTDVVYGYWKDERYTVKEDLLAAAQEKLAELAFPKRSYECDVIDLKSIDPEKYSAFDLSLYQRISLKDVSRETEHIYQVVKVRNYPNCPEKNIITLSTTAPTLTAKLQEIESEVEEFNGKIEESQSWLTDNVGGKIYFIRDDDGNITSMILKCGDSENPPIWVFNKNGIGYSADGITGTPIVAMTADGSIIADFVDTGKIAGWNINDHSFSTTNGGGAEINSQTGKLTLGNMYLYGDPNHTGAGCPLIRSTAANGDIMITTDRACAFGYLNSGVHHVTGYIYTDYNNTGESHLHFDYLDLGNDGLRALKADLARV